MIAAEVQYSLGNLMKTFSQYAALSSKAEDESLAHVASNVAWNAYQGMRKIMPAKGSIRAEAEALLKSGKGIKVRPVVLADVAARYGALTSVKSGDVFLAQKKRGKVTSYSQEVIGKNGKPMNLQALAVEKEISVREAGRGFSAFAVPRPVKGFKGDQEIYEKPQVSRFNFKASDFTFVASGEKKFAELLWIDTRSPLYNSPVAGLLKSKQQHILVEAVKDADKDMKVYIERKLAEAAKQTGLS